MGVQSLNSLSSADDLTGKQPRPAAKAPQQIRCAGCNCLAPQNLTIAGPGAGRASEPVEWWCALCRSEAASLPQPVPYYTTLRELGRGAMGVVYQARHNMTGQMVALKLIMPETATTRAAIDRFQREMSVISQLRHPNIVEWYEQGHDPGSVLVCDGVCRRHQPRDARQGQPRPLPHQPGLPAGLARCSAGSARPTSTDSFIATSSPRTSCSPRRPMAYLVKISDFGLAKSFRGVGLSGLTFSGEMRGTVPFMPPEQMLDFKTVTPLADLYATAATLYYLLTCQYVYDEPTGGGDLIRMLLEEPSIPIRTRRPDVDPALAEVIEKCLARDPKVRYPDATSMRRALKPFC